MKKILKVYVTGPLNAPNALARDRQMGILDLTCRRVLVAGHAPICPVIHEPTWGKDPRLIKDLDWWLRIYGEMMLDCDMLCYVPMSAGTVCKRMQAEIDTWRAVGTGEIVTSDVILDYLLSKKAEAILD